MRDAPRLLLVEDDANDALLAERRLKAAFPGATVRRVDDPESFAEALAGGDWDVVVSDRRLPRFGALEALEALRVAGRHVPLVVVSGAASAEDDELALRAGARACLDKRDLARLPEAVANALAGS